MATFDARVLEICLINFAEMLHAHLYMYILAFALDGVSVATLGVEDTPAQSIFSGP